MAPKSPASGKLLSLSLSISHRTGTSAPLLSVSTPTPPFGFIPLPRLGRWAAQSAPTPRTSGISAARLVCTGSKVEPLGATSRIIAPHFRASGDGFLVWGSFPRLVRVGIEVDPEGLPHVLSRLTLALSMLGFFPLGSFGRWAAQSAPTPRTGSKLAARLVHTFKVTIFCAKRLLVVSGACAHFLGVGIGLVLLARQRVSRSSSRGPRRGLSVR